MAQPRHPDTLAYRQPDHARANSIDPSYDFVARNDREMRIGQLSVDDMQVGATHTTCCYLDPYLTLTGLPVRKLGPFQS
jgi:hypothetical protein